MGAGGRWGGGRTEQVQPSAEPCRILVVDRFDGLLAALAADRESGASEILARAITVLREALADPAATVPLIAGRICATQPGMAPLWNAGATAVAARESADPERFERFAARVHRAPDALARFALERLCPDSITAEPGPRLAPLRVVTVSNSGSVGGVLEVLAQRVTLRVACAEGRPAVEGRLLAARLAAAGALVDFFTDAGIGQALGAADAVLVGADAVAPEWFLNKVGTRVLASAAQLQSVPVYIVASRDKLATHALAERLVPRDGPVAEVWGTAPGGVAVRNPYFERVPLDLVTAVITDLGVLSPEMVVEACAALEQELPASLFDELGRFQRALPPPDLS